MIEVLRRSPVLHVGGGKTVTLGNVRPPAKSLSLSAEALSLNGEATRYQVELLGLDTFDPATMEPDHRGGDDVPAWFLDHDYNELLVVQKLPR